MLLPMNDVRNAVKMAKNELKGKCRIVSTQKLAEIEGCCVK
jgi:hypothetical protein